MSCEDLLGVVAPSSECRIQFTSKLLLPFVEASRQTQTHTHTVPVLNPDCEKNWFEFYCFFQFQGFVFYFILFRTRGNENSGCRGRDSTFVKTSESFFSLHAMQWTRVMNKPLTSCKNSFCVSWVFFFPPWTCCERCVRWFDACQPTP